MKMTMNQQFWVLTTVENHFDYSYSLQSAFSVPFILFTKSKPRRQPRDTKAVKMRIEKAKTLSQVFSMCSWALMSSAERIWRGFSCRAAVCSEWTSCSLLILVSQCSLSSQGLPKRRTDRASLQCTQRQILLLQGVLFRGYQQASG